jgi:AcrR family transcriptional regulator
VEPTIQTPSDESRDDGRKARTHARILDAALELFSARGFDGTSVAAIAARARVSRSAVFWHFGDKTTLFQEACRRMLEPFVRELERTLEHLDARKRLEELFAVYETFVSENRPAIETIVRWVLESPILRASLQRPLLALHAVFARDVRQAIEEVLGDAGRAAELSAGIVSLLDGNLVLSLIDPGEKSRELRRAGLRAIAELALPPEIRD